MKRFIKIFIGWSIILGTYWITYLIVSFCEGEFMCLGDLYEWRQR